MTRSKQHMVMRDLVERGPWAETRWKEEIKSGELRAYRIGARRLLISEDDYQAYLARKMSVVCTGK